MPSGTADKTQLQAIVNNAQASGAIVSPPTAPYAVVASATAALPPTSATVIQNALTQSNAAKSTSPTPTGTSTPVVGSTASDLNIIDSTKDDIDALEKGTVATLQWWGWTLTLTESATQALIRLIQTDFSGLWSIVNAFCPVLSIFSALEAILTAGLDAWITNEDNAHGGVRIYGYLWIGVWVEPE
jgi:hypothetical protein